MATLRDTQTYYLDLDPMEVIDHSILDFIHSHAGPEVLDLGCGLGGYSRLLMDRGHRVKALDVNPNYVEIARRLGVDAATYDGAAIPMADGSVDTVVLVEVLEHVKDYEPLIKELSRVARRNVIITVPNCTQSFNAPVVFNHMLDIDHKNFFTVASLKTLLSDTFPAVEVRQVSPLDAALARDVLPDWVFRIFRLLVRFRILRPRFYFRLIADATK